MVRRTILLALTALAAAFAATSAVADTTPATTPQTFGDPLDAAPADQLASTGAADLFQLSVAGAAVVAPADGVIVRWRLRAKSTASSYALQLLRGDGPYAVVAQTTAVAPAAGGAITTVPAQLPVLQGDRLALRSGAPSGGGSAGRFDALAAPAVGTTAVLAGFAPPLAAGSSGPANATGLPADRLLVQADIEPDTDHDGKGDLTQDEVADLDLTGAAPAEVSALTRFAQSYTVHNLGPNASPGVTIEGIDGTEFAASDTCPGGGPRCVLGPMAPGASVTVTAAFVEPAVFPPFPGTFKSAARLTSATVDPVASNDAASLATVRDPYDGPPIVISPPVVMDPKPCSNLVHGTSDDDALFGTIYGDRLVGSDGKDLLKGDGGNDCLEGGAGGDVLDGGSGDDRLTGSLGNDRLMGGSGNDVISGGAGNDQLLGGAGNDTLQPGSGRDHVLAGPGDDVISAVDGVRETIDCGPGHDTVRADRKDRLRSCEKVTRR